MQDLERACKDHLKRRCWGIGFGLNFRVIALDPNFRKLSPEHIISAYKRTKNHAILLDYDGTMVSQTSIYKTPGGEIISVLNALCNDLKNVVFIVSGRSREELSGWFSPCKNLGIATEHGYYMRYAIHSNKSNVMVNNLGFYIVMVFHKYCVFQENSSWVVCSFKGFVKSLGNIWSITCFVLEIE